MRLLKRFLFFIFLAVFIALNLSSVLYGLQQGFGQAQILLNTKTVHDVKQDPSTPDSIRYKLELIQKIKTFAEDSLGLKKTSNYTSFYDQKGKPVLWSVTASPEFKIEAYKWSFPIAGSFPYKGFFNYARAESEQKRLVEKGFDTEIGEVSAWSTLGWFNDPILSSMLNRPVGSLANLIIHESTHATIYIKDSVQFNENLASFIGKKGADRFLSYHFGPNSSERNNYLEQLNKRDLFRNFMKGAIEKLSAQYKSLDSSILISKKRKLKAKWIEELKVELANSGYYENEAIGLIKLKEFHPNNAYFSGFNTYSNEMPLLEKELKTKFKGDLKSMVSSFKSNGLSL